MDILNSIYIYRYIYRGYIWIYGYSKEYLSPCFRYFFCPIIMLRLFVQNSIANRINYRRSIALRNSLSIKLFRKTKVFTINGEEKVASLDKLTRIEDSPHFMAKKVRNRIEFVRVN